MKTIRTKPEKLSIFAQVSRYQTLVDKRGWSRGIVFGNVEDVARQYNVVMKEENGGITFTAPKSRLQIFVEKLHFSGIPYNPV